MGFSFKRVKEGAGSRMGRTRKWGWDGPAGKTKNKL